MDIRKPFTRRHVLAAGAAVAAAPLMPVNTLAQSGRKKPFLVDCQVHLYKDGKASDLQQPAPFLMQKLLPEMDAAGVERVVVVTPSWSASGNDYPLQAAKEHPDRFRVVGVFDIFAPPDPAAIENWKKQDGMLGIRIVVNSPKAREWMTSGAADWLWPALERANIPLMIFPGDVAAFTAVAAKYPGLKLCIDSFGVPTRVRGQTAFAKYDEILALARFPNVTIKAESVPFLSAEPYPYRDMQPVLRKTFDAFGPERIFWGSDYTLMSMHQATYSECVRAFTEELTWLSEKDLALIMGTALSKWIGWPLPV